MLGKRIIGAAIGTVIFMAAVLSGCGNVNEAVTHSAKKMGPVEAADLSASELSARITPEPTPMPTPEPEPDMSPCLENTRRRQENLG